MRVGWGGGDSHVWVIRLEDKKLIDQLSVDELWSLLFLPLPTLTSLGVGVGGREGENTGCRFDK